MLTGLGTWLYVYHNIFLYIFNVVKVFFSYCSDLELFCFSVVCIVERRSKGVRFLFGIKITKTKTIEKQKINLATGISCDCRRPSFLRKFLICLFVYFILLLLFLLISFYKFLCIFMFAISLLYCFCFCCAKNVVIVFGSRITFIEDP